jgi:diguanylate cyclase (GGDEF)-like protein
VDPSAKILFDYMHDIIYDPDNANLELDSLRSGFRELGKGMQYFAACLKETQTLAKDLSQGRLDIPLPAPENEMAAPLKALHAKMKHLNWQAQQIARGDYSQRIDFMGEFANAFNAMTEQLECRRAKLLDEIENGRQKAMALEQNNSLLEAITGKISQWIIVMSRTNFEWLYTNHQAGDILCSPAFESSIRLWMKNKAEDFSGTEQPCLAELEFCQGVVTQYFSVEIYPLSWHEHNALVFMMSDVSSEKEHMFYLQNAAYTDMLTKLYNRGYAMKVLDEWLSENRSFILCFVDIDNLKYVNDRFGHREGDKYILAVAEVLYDFSPEAVLCRMGGDEFMLLAQNWCCKNAEEQMEVLRTRLINCNIAEGNCYDHSISYGIIEYDGERDLKVHDLLSIADEKMYEYKRAYKMRHKINVDSSVVDETGFR